MYNGRLVAAWFVVVREHGTLYPFSLLSSSKRLPFASVLVKQEQSTYNSALAIFLFRVQHGRRKG